MQISFSGPNSPPTPLRLLYTTSLACELLLSTTLPLKFDLFSNSSSSSQEPLMESTNRHHELEAQDDELPTTRRPPAQLRPAPVSKTAGSRKKTVPQRRKIGGQSELAMRTTPSTVVEGEEINNTQLVVRTRSERGNRVHVHIFEASLLTHHNRHFEIDGEPAS